ncbi:MAG TPA: NAD-dependent epimerase/dehydratase family protein [Acidobacteriaceae bacterium]|nr:NAD-dependent epimerase/dehydratase family protein [Acidobacteriaceae bacterium]
MTRTPLEQAAEPAGEVHSVHPNPGKSLRKVAFVGAGYIADWHAKSIRSVSNVELVAVCDRVVPKAEALARKFGVPQVYDSLDAMLAEARPDAVHVLLPPDRHFEAAQTILEAGAGVFLEKPMCSRAADCDSLVRLAEDRGLRLGVGHNFLFAEPYERLRRDLRSGILGKIDQLTVTWHRPLPPILFGPFDVWMLREPRNILLEIGSHSAAHVLDLIGKPQGMQVIPSNPVELPTGKTFFRRWQVNAFAGCTAIEMRFSFVPAFSEYTIHIRGSLASAVVDFERNTYILDRHRPADPDFDAHAMLRSRAKELNRQARKTLQTYLGSKIGLNARGNPYGASIASAMDAFYAPGNAALDPRVDGRLGAEVIGLCERMGELAHLPEPTAKLPQAVYSAPAAAPQVLVLGATGFIGKELLRQLAAAGIPARALVRNPASLPRTVLDAGLDCQRGDLTSTADLERAMQGVHCVFHLARSNVKTWAEYEELEVGVTRRVAECALRAGVKRLVYTGTIASYYQGAGASTITESTPLDPGIARGNFYARAKTISEGLLLQMHKEQGLPVVILRPGIVIGRGGSPFHWGVGMWWHDAVCRTWGGGSHKLPFVLVGDVVAALIAAIEKPGIEGQSFNLVADPCLSAGEYLDALDRCGGIRIQRHATPIFRFYFTDLMKWGVKVALRYPERQRLTYRDWESRTLRAPFDCSAAKTVLGWKPVSARAEFIRRGIEEPLREFTE